MLLKYKLYFLFYMFFFPFSYGIYALFYEYLKTQYIPVVQLFLAIISIIFILKFGKKWIFFSSIRNFKEALILFFILACLFAINNYLIINYDTLVPWKIEFQESHILAVLWSYFLSSTAEEIIYRGFIQNYINYYAKSVNTKTISIGNWIATSIMTLIHIGFFAYFNLIFAFSSIFLVLIFSLVSGYIMDKTRNIIIVIIMHILINFVHYFVCLGVLKDYI